MPGCCLFLIFASSQWWRRYSPLHQRKGLSTGQLHGTDANVRISSSSLFLFFLQKEKRREAKVKKPITNIKKSGWLTGLYNRLGNCCPSTSPVTWRWPADVRSQNMPPMPWFTRATFFFLHHFFVSFYCWAIDSSSSHTLLPSHLSE